MFSFWSRPPLATFPTMRLGTTSTAHSTLLQAEFQTLLDKGAIEIPEDPSSLGFYSRLFLVPKPNQHWRVVINLSLLNEYIKILKFRMDTPQRSIHP